jgi:guanylate kinase
VTARAEVAAVAEYDYVVINDELGSAVDRLRAIVLAERARLDAMSAAVSRVVDSFAGKESV